MTQAVQQTPKNAQASKQAAASAANKKPDKKPDPNSPEAKKVQEQNREQGGMLSAVKDGVGKTVDVATQAGAEVMKESAKTSLSTVLHSVIHPLRMQLNMPPLVIVKGPIMSFLSSSLDKYMKENQVDIGMSAQEIVTELIDGNLDKLSGEVTNLVTDFVQKSMSDDLKNAIAQKSPTKIAMAAGTSLTTGAKGLFSQMFNMPNSNKFTSFFKFFGQKIPFVNKLGPKWQPWAAGAFLFTFGGAIVRLTAKFVNLIFKGGILAGGAVLAKKIFDKMMPGPGKAQAPQAPGGMLGNIAKMAAGPGASPMHAAAGQAKGGGLGQALGAATDLLGMFAGPKR